MSAELEFQRRVAALSNDQLIEMQRVIVEGYDLDTALQVAEAYLILRPMRIALDRIAAAAAELNTYALEWSDWLHGTGGLEREADRYGRMLCHAEGLPYLDLYSRQLSAHGDTPADRKRLRVLEHSLHLVSGLHRTIRARAERGLA